MLSEVFPDGQSCTFLHGPERPAFTTPTRTHHGGHQIAFGGPAPAGKIRDTK